jgi:ATPases of the AAA+ class
VSPSPCLLAPVTEIKISEPVKISVEEFEEDVEVTVSAGDNETYYVYPKNVWERIYEYVDSFVAKGHPEEPAMILIGPPGTGKSSMMRILSDMMGVYTVEVEPESALSMWLGQSEKNLRRMFEEAEANSPSMVLFDEAEWILSKTSVVRRSLSDNTFLNMKTILKRKIDEYGKKKEPILTIFASNISEEDIEETMIRSGRAYRPIFVPLPDWHGIKRIIERYFPEKRDESEKLATIMLNAGLSMADVMRVMKTYVRTGKIKIEEMRTRGYSRLFMSPELAGDASVQRYLREIVDRYDLERVSRHPNPKIFMECSYHVCGPILAAALVAIVRRPVMTVTDVRYIDEALDMSRSINSMLLVPSDFMPRDVVQNMLSQKTSTIFIGREKVEGAYITKMTVVPRDMRLRMAPVIILSEMLRIEIDDKMRVQREIEKMTDVDYEKFLESFAQTGSLVLSSRRVS